MKLKGDPDFRITIVGYGRVMPDENGIVETDNKDAIRICKEYGFKEVKEAKKEPKKK